MKHLLTLILSLFFIVSTQAQILNPVKWTYSTERVSKTEYNLVFSAKIDKDWHLYSVYSPENGPLPLFFEYEKSDNYELIGKINESPKPHEVYDETFKVTIKQFSNRAVFTQKIKIKATSEFVVKGLLDGQSCLDDGMCVPITDDFELKISPSAEIKSDKKEITVEETETPDSHSTEEVAIVTEEVENSDASEEIIETNNTEELAEEHQTTETTELTAENITEEGSNAEEESDISFWIIFAVAFGAGMLTLITPCVFPMIPMTISFFMKGNKSRSAGLKQAYFFGFSIVMIFAVLGLALTLLLGQDAMYIISTHWLPNIIFFLIFMIFAMSFFGMFEITLPSWIVNKSDEQADKGGYLGVFFVAFTTVLVSFSCTGPILGAALIELSSGSDNSIVFFISMIGFALGFAVPFTLLAMSPTALSKLKSGSWLNSVKIVFGFIEIALGLKFLSMADLGANWGLLDRETFLALWIVVFALLGFYLLGKLKFKGDNDLKQISVSRLFMAIATFSFVIYMIPGLWGAPLKILSGYVPPMTTQDFDINRIIVENSGGVSSNHSPEEYNNAKYSDILHLPTGFNGFFDLEEAKAYSKKVNKPIFIDFTGKTCANCREMESNVWSDKEVKRLLNEEFVIVALYADANFIDLEENEWITTKEGKVIKKLGKKNLNYQIETFNMNAQPYYVLMGSDETVLTKENKAYDKNVSNFINFLQEGLENYKKQ